MEAVKDDKDSGGECVRGDTEKRERENEKSGTAATFDRDRARRAIVVCDKQRCRVVLSTFMTTT